MNAVVKEPVTGLEGATKVLDDDRMDFLPRHFPRIGEMMTFENLVFSFASKFVEGYKGGYWDFYDIENEEGKAPLMVPTGLALAPGEMLRFTPPSGYAEHLTESGVGIAVTLYALNHCTFKYETEATIKAFYALRRFAMNHPDSAAIFSVID